MNRILLFLSLVGVLSGALSAQVPATKKITTPAQRVFRADSFYVPVWAKGFGNNEGQFVEPRQLTVVDNSVVVLDAGTREIQVFDLQTGKQRLTRAATGTGPGEFRRPDMIARHGAGFVVTDQETRRLTAFSLNGKVLWDIPTPSLSPTVCAASPTTVTFKVRGSRDALVTYDTSGKLLATRSLPWTHSEKEEMTTTAVAASTARGDCVFARIFGPDFVIVSPDGKIKAVPYVEPIAEPKVEVTRKTLEKSLRESVVQETQTPIGDNAAAHVSIYHDTLAVLFSGRTPLRRIVLDFYHIPSGRYVYSRKMPMLFSAIGIGPNGQFVGATIGEETSGLISFKPSTQKPNFSWPGEKPSRRR